MLSATGAADQAVGSKLIVLLTNDIIGERPDVLRVRDTIRNAGFPVRVLMLVSDENGLELAQRLAEAEIELELLLSSNVPDPPASLNFARMQPGLSSACMQPMSKLDDRDELGLALSDVILADPAQADHKLVGRAVELGKPVIAPGAPLPALPTISSVTNELDPVTLSRCKWRCNVAGRLEQGLSELLAFRMFRPDEGTLSKRLRRLRRCFGSGAKWRPSPYFGPDDCVQLVPDTETFDPRSPLVMQFNALDRSALFGSYIHRDLGWAAHFGAAFAVLAAVAGMLAEHSSVALAITELVLLVLIALIVFSARRGRLQDRWTACRLGAEQLRIARMCLPLLVLPRALISEDIWPGRPKPDRGAIDLSYQALSEVKRAIRDHGLPRVDGSGSKLQAARWLDCIVMDQINYHEGNHRKLERVEESLQAATALLFFAAMVAVLWELAAHAWHCFPDLHWLPLITAAGPAFAAACHGVATRLAFVHRIALSKDVRQRLEKVHEVLTEIIHRPELTDKAWGELRKQAFDAAEAMGSENQSWQSLVRLQPDALPA